MGSGGPLVELQHNVHMRKWEDETVNFAICATALESISSLLIYSEDKVQEPHSSIFHGSWGFLRE